MVKYKWNKPVQQSYIQNGRPFFFISTFILLPVCGISLLQMSNGLELSKTIFTFRFITDLNQKKLPWAYSDMISCASTFHGIFIFTGNRIPHTKKISNENVIIH